MHGNVQNASVGGMATLAWDCSGCQCQSNDDHCGFKVNQDKNHALDNLM